jgi:hypothetical protein
MKKQRSKLRLMLPAGFVSMWPEGSDNGHSSKPPRGSNEDPRRRAPARTSTKIDDDPLRNSPQ